jgi:hypothetical protein
VLTKVFGSFFFKKERLACLLRDQLEGGWAKGVDGPGEPGHDVVLR